MGAEGDEAVPLDATGALQDLLDRQAEVVQAQDGEDPAQELEAEPQTLEKGELGRTG